MARPGPAKRPSSPAFTDPDKDPAYSFDNAPQASWRCSCCACPAHEGRSAALGGRDPGERTRRPWSVPTAIIASDAFTTAQASLLAPSWSDPIWKGARTLMRPESHERRNKARNPAETGMCHELPKDSAFRSDTEAIMTRLIAARCSRSMHEALRDLCASFKVSSFAYLLRTAPDLVPNSVRSA